MSLEQGLGKATITQSRLFFRYQSKNPKGPSPEPPNYISPFYSPYFVWQIFSTSQLLKLVLGCFPLVVSFVVGPLCVAFLFCFSLFDSFSFLLSNIGVVPGPGPVPGPPGTCTDQESRDLCDQWTARPGCGVPQVQQLCARSCGCPRQVPQVP